MKLTKTGRARLEKLIGFLEELPRKQFDFGEVVDERKCGTVACAVGWTFRIFPRLVKREIWYGQIETVAVRKTNLSGFSEVASALFGISEELANALFLPDTQREAHPTLPVCKADATPKQVAKMLSKFITLADAGKIA